jgi:hypothetical protein
MVRYAALPPEFAAQLERVPASRDRDLEYRPCRVVLTDGRQIDCVYIVDAEAYIRAWGVWPEDDAGKRSVRIEDVREIRDSPFRLPAGLANLLYAAGESGMGGCHFVVEFGDGTRQAYVTGNAVDFVPAPQGLRTSDATGVIPHAGRHARPLPGLDYWWCLYS